MATQAERIEALEIALAAEKEANVLQKAQIDILEGKLILVLDYLDQRVVDRLNKLEWLSNRICIGAYLARNVLAVWSQKLFAVRGIVGDGYKEMFDSQDVNMQPFLGQSIQSDLSPEPPVPTRNELEAQIVSPPTTPAPVEPEA